MDLGKDKLYGHIKPKKNRTRFLEFCRYLRSLYPLKIRIAIVLDNFSPYLTTEGDTRVGDWAAANNVEFAYTPINSSWLNRIEAQFTALRYFTLDGTDHASACLWRARAQTPAAPDRATPETDRRRCCAWRSPRS